MEFFNYKATDVWLADGQIWVKLEDGKTASEPIVRYPLLAKATPEQLKNVEVIDGYALYWPELDEDLSVTFFFEKATEQEPAETASIFHTS